METPEGHAPAGRPLPTSIGPRWLRAIIGTLFYAASLLLLVEAARRDWLQDWSRHLDGSEVASAIAFGVVARYLMARCWSGLLQAGAPAQAQRDGRESAIYAVTALGKYIPGKVLTVAARTYLSRRLDVPLARAVEASAREPFLNIGAVTATGGVLLLVTNPAWGAALTVAGFMVTFLALRSDTTRIWQHLRHWRESWGGHAIAGTERPGYSLALLAFGSAVAQGLCVLTIATAQLPGMNVALACTTIGTFMISHVVGVLVFLSPAGMGVREGAQAAMLSQHFSAEALAAFLVACRLVDIAADALFALGGAIRLMSARRGYDG